MDRRYVGIDLHRRRSVIYAMDADGDRLFCERVDERSDASARGRRAQAGLNAEVVIEATYGWYWAVDLLATRGSRCIWRTRRGTIGGTGGSRTTNATPVISRTFCAWVAWPKRGSLHRRCVKHVSWFAIERSWCSCAAGSRRRCTR